jgi:hypothetical protein
MLVVLVAAGLLGFAFYAEESPRWYKEEVEKMKG